VCLHVRRPSDHQHNSTGDGEGGVDRTFVNFAKAKWDVFTAEIKAALADRTATSVLRSQWRKVWRRIANKAHMHPIPCGRIHQVIPSFPTEAAKLADERDDLRGTDPTSPRLAEQNNEIE